MECLGLFVFTCALAALGAGISRSLVYLDNVRIFKTEPPSRSTVGGEG